MTLQEAKSNLVASLLSIYGEIEAKEMAAIAIEHLTGFNKTQQVLYKNEPISALQLQTLQTITAQLLQHKPIQQIIGYTWFAGEKFLVNEHVLIPRPETDELVSWIVEDKKHKKNLSIIDIGTGSGCIAISLAMQLKQANIFGIDVSEKALDIAKQNAERILHYTAKEHRISQNIENLFASQSNNSFKVTSKIQFQQINFLDSTSWQVLPKFDIIISNPPYIKQSETAQMQQNVLQYEPHEALFVPNNNALIFYKAIAQFAKNHLKPNGSVYVEINEALGKETEAVFTNEGFKTMLRKDLQGKDRMILIEND